MDAYAGVSRGTEQWTVRASRELGADGDTAAVGPIRYEVLEPMRRIRFALDANDAQPISFEWIFEGVVPAVLENHEVHRARDGRRIDADIARYHHIGTAHGWVDVDGRAHRVRRRHVGVHPRSLVGRSVPGRRPDRRRRARAGADERRDDGDLVADPHDASGRHALRPAHLLPTPRVRRLAAHRAAGRLRTRRRAARALRRARSRARRRPGEPSPARRRAARDDERRHAPATSRSPRSRRPASTSAPGCTSASTVTGTASGAGDSTSTASTSPTARRTKQARRLHQLRDCIVRVDDPVGGGVGVGNLQSIVAGPHPELGPRRAVVVHVRTASERGAHGRVAR